VRRFLPLSPHSPHSTPIAPTNQPITTINHRIGNSASFNMQFIKTILAIAAIVTITSAAAVSRSCRKQSACDVEGEIKCGKQTFALTSRES
jgi:hypothetical protein